MRGNCCRCCLDAQPRTLTVQDVNMLCNFAELVVREVEKKHVVSPYAWHMLGTVLTHTSGVWYIPAV